MFAITQPGNGGCDFKGEGVGQAPDYAQIQVNITDVVRGWLDGCRPNCGLGVTCRPPIQATADWRVSWFKAWLNIEFEQPK
jgi:hypothetical protein